MPASETASALDLRQLVWASQLSSNRTSGLIEKATLRVPQYSET